MSSKIQKLSILAGLLAAVGSTHAAVINVGSGSSFSFSCNVADMLSGTATNACTASVSVYNNSDTYISTTNPGAGGYAYVMWHFQTSGTNVTFGNDLKFGGRMTDWAFGGTSNPSQVYVLTSTVGDVNALDNQSLANWAWYWSVTGNNYPDQTWSAASLNGVGAGSSDFYMAFYVKNSATAYDGNTWNVEFFRENTPFTLSGSLITAPVPEPASLALLGLAATPLLYRRRR